MEGGWHAPAVAGHAHDGRPGPAVHRFFLFVEEEGIDEASHANDGAAMLAAMRSLDEAVGAARRFVAANPEILVIVTGDHETGGLSVDRGSDLRWRTGEHTDAPTPVFATGPGQRPVDG